MPLSTSIAAVADDFSAADSPVAVASATKRLMSFKKSLAAGSASSTSLRKIAVSITTTTADADAIVAVVVGKVREAGSKAPRQLMNAESEWAK